MPTPLQLLNEYRNLQVGYVRDTGQQCVEASATIKLRKYFMMNWTDGTEQRDDFNHVTRGSRNNDWFQANKEKIKTAAMGKGSPEDYRLALEWAVVSGKIPGANPASIQTFCDERLGIDCSGFATNYLIANGKKGNSDQVKRNTNAASYYSASHAVNDPRTVRQGDLLVWMSGNSVKRSPGHIAVVESYQPMSMTGGNMRVVESTGAGGANPKLLDSMYTVEQIIDKGGRVPCMILVVKRHGASGSRVSVMRY